MMTYAEALDYLYSQLPMFQRVGAAAYKNDLNNTIALCAALGNPERELKCIHVAGTNGKGSVSSTLASIFMECGYKTALFTSPHLVDFRERIRVNGEMIPEAEVVLFLEKSKHLIAELKPSFFELTCCMAFEHFRQSEVDIAILEVGMGGRLDSTNVVMPELAIITSIGLDHQQFLGDTLEKIAAEKGGIIKPNVPVVIAENEPEVIEVLENIAHSRSAPIVAVRSSDQGLETDLGGIYQLENMRTVRKAVDVMRDMGWQLPLLTVEKAALKVVQNTDLRGRWELLSQKPRIIADVGHNEEGVALVAQMLAAETFEKLHIVWGMVADKDAAKILGLLPRDATYYWCKPDVPRGKDAELLQSEAALKGLNGASFNGVAEALSAAKSAASEADLIFVGGSVFVVAEVL